jgi:hypothetical protein
LRSSNLLLTAGWYCVPWTTDDWPKLKRKFVNIILGVTHMSLTCDVQEALIPG